MSGLIIPRYKLEVQGRTIFLAGPIQGTSIWRNKATEYLFKRNKEIYVASPDIRVKKASGQNEVFSSETFRYQLDWECYYLDQASKKGAILFWLPNQTENMPLNEETGFPQPYARDTRPETAGWGWKLLESNPEAKVVIGGERNFDGWDVIKRNFLRIRPSMKFYSTLEETCDEALRLAA